MLGLTDYVVVIVVNAIDSDDKKSANYFDRTSDIRTAALRSIYTDTVGNQHARSNIQKQAYTSDKVGIVRQAYGLTGTRYSTHSPFRAGKAISLDSTVNKFDEILLIKNRLDVEEAYKTAGVHRIIPERNGS